MVPPVLDELVITNSLPAVLLQAAAPVIWNPPMMCVLPEASPLTVKVSVPFDQLDPVMLYKF